MTWNSNITWDKAKQRAGLLAKIRKFFAIRDVVEVETPLMARSTVTDVHLEGFESNYDFFTDIHEPDINSLYLQTSPEYAMKRLLASGFGSIYQLCKAFRHEEAGRFHNPEFTMLEWYRVDYDHYQLIDEVSEFLVEILGCESADTYTYQELFLSHTKLDPLDTSIEALKSSLLTAGVQGDWIDSENDKDVLLQVIFTECIEPKIGTARPCIVTNFPSSQASLAKISKSDSRVADRFECYYQGVELANGFNELTDVDEQIKRFNQDNYKRKELGKQPKAIDNNFIGALTKGLPQCAGVALGVDRLMMIALGESSISQTMPFTINNA